MLNSKDKIQNVILKTISESSNFNIKELNESTKLDELEILNDSLNSIIFFNTLEDNLKKELGENCFIEIERIESLDKILNVNDLVHLVSNLVNYD